MTNVRSLKSEKNGKDVLTRASGWCSDAIEVASDAAGSVTGLVRESHHSYGIYIRHSSYSATTSYPKAPVLPS